MAINTATDLYWFCSIAKFSTATVPTVNISVAAAQTCLGFSADGVGSLCVTAHIPIAPPPAATTANIKTYLTVRCVRWDANGQVATEGSGGGWTEAGCLVDNVFWNQNSTGGLGGGSNWSMIPSRGDLMTVVCICNATGLFKALYLFLILN